LSHFSIFMHEYMMFPTHSSSFTFSLCPPLSTGTNTRRPFHFGKW
jgi:hypothetical protein